MTGKLTRYQVATFLAILFHAIGIAGILFGYFGDRDFFVRSTPFNLLLMFGLLVWTQQEKNISFFIFMAACFAVGIAVEIIGVNTSLLFGDYSYGKVLGPQIRNVPWLIGVNWFIIIYCSGVSVFSLLMRIISRNPVTEEATPKSLKALSVVVDGATLAVFFDWLMEPVAVKLAYWKWLGEGSIPFFNYVCWFFVSILLLLLFHLLKFEKRNKFAVNLLLIQLMFFLILRTFLN